MISWRGQINEMLRHDADYAEVAQPEVDTHHSRTHRGTLGSDVPNLFPFPQQASAKNRKAPSHPLATRHAKTLLPPLLQPSYSPAVRVPQIVIILLQGQLATGVL